MRAPRAFNMAGGHARSKKSWHSSDYHRALQCWDGCVIAVKKQTWHINTHIKPALKDGWLGSPGVQASLLFFASCFRQSIRLDTEFKSVRIFSIGGDRYFESFLPKIVWDFWSRVSVLLFLCPDDMPKMKRQKYKSFSTKLSPFEVGQVFAYLQEGCTSHWEIVGKVVKGGILPKKSTPWTGLGIRNMRTPRNNGT